jgi:hypothetical protein
MRSKEKFEKPMMEVVRFEAEDIIVTSQGGCTYQCKDICTDDCILIQK